MTRSITTWKQALTKARKQEALADRTHRQCHELHDYTIEFTNAKEARKLISVIRGLGWYYPPDEELESIILGREDQHLYSFGENIHKQLPQVIGLLRDDPSTRRAVIQFAHIGDENLAQAHLPCLLSATLRIHKDAVDISLHARSIDLFIGLPANVYMACLLVEHIAELLSKKPGKIRFFMNSAHVFSDYDEQLEQVLSS